MYTLTKVDSLPSSPALTCYSKHPMMILNDAIFPIRKYLSEFAFFPARQLPDKSSHPSGHLCMYLVASILHNFRNLKFTEFLDWINWHFVVSYVRLFFLFLFQKCTHLLFDMHGLVVGSNFTMLCFWCSASCQKLIAAVSVLRKHAFIIYSIRSLPIILMLEKTRPYFLPR